MQLPIRECAWCNRQFVPTRIDARFCCREHLDKWFVRERKQAVALWREMQRHQKIFQVDTTLDEPDEEMQQVRKVG